MTALIFIGLSIADAHLTRVALELGAREANPLAGLFGENMLVKGVVAVVVVLALYLFGKERLLWYLNFAMFGVVLWNLVVCVMLNAGSML